MEKNIKPVSGFLALIIGIIVFVSGILIFAKMAPEQSMFVFVGILLDVFGVFLF